MNPQSQQFYSEIDACRVARWARFRGLLLGILRVFLLCAGCMGLAPVGVNAADVAPSITSQPSSLIVNAGSSATFTVAATGTAPLSYQWLKNGTNIAGGTSATYSITSTQFSDAGFYTVSISNAAGTLTSGSANLTVLSTVTNVSFAQRPDRSGLVDVSYNLLGGSSSVALAVSYDGGTTFNAVQGLTGDVGAAISAGSAKHIVWNAGTDYPSSGSANVKMRVTALLDGAGGAFAPIPAGIYQRGDNLDGENALSLAPIQLVTLSPYYMSVNDTTKAQWDAVREWGLAHGYTDLAAGAGKAANHPVQNVSWREVVKWANAASEKEGLTPCYSVGGSVVRTGTSDAVICDWSANGYRLPTEAEWEVAARGGLIGKRFPWGDAISQSQANYLASGAYAYDLSGTVNDFHPTYKTSPGPYTSPVGSFAANGYGLHDMAGNMRNWCWDWVGDYVAGSDPRGPSSPTSGRRLRGGCWDDKADRARCSARSWNPPSYSTSGSGFRLARGRSSAVGAGVLSSAGVVDTTAPVLASLPANVTVNATSASGANVTFSGASGTDNVGSPTFTYSPASGSTFAVGNTTVTVTATDNVGNTATGTFTVTVLPGVGNVSFAQRPDRSGLVDVSYNLLGGSSSVALAVSYDGGTTFNAVQGLTGDVGAAISAGSAKHIVWNAGADYPSSGSANVKMRVTALLDGAGGTFAPIPAGTYQRGDNLDGGSGGSAGPEPVQMVTLSPYYMSVNDTTKAQWDAVRLWGLSNDYTDLRVGVGKASNHPVVYVSWYDVVKWANAASEQEGLTPCYSVNGSVVRSGTSDAVTCDWSANGYRLPTEAEWEIAARGGLVGKRFPWGDTISQSQANYKADPSFAYDLSGEVNDYHPTYKTGSFPYTSPVGSFAANGYGLYDMAGNASNWCWNWVGVYVAGIDPRGPAGNSTNSRISRGAAWSSSAGAARCAGRGGGPAFVNYNTLGFRLARGRSSVVGVGVLSTAGVVDTTAPVLTNVPANVTVNATSASGANVTFSGASGTDNVGSPTFTYSPASGSTFAVGNTTVTVTATDNVGNTATGTFTVTVLPGVGNVSFAQRPDRSGLVDVSYNLLGGSSSVALAVSYDGGTTFNAVQGLTGDVGTAISAGSAKHIVWNAGADYPSSGSANVKMRVTALLAGAGGTFAPIPAGTYQRGDNLDGSSFAPVQMVTLSPYYMSINDTTKAQWDAVRFWGLTNGYTDLAIGAGKASNHPVVYVNWCDVVKWANAASEKEGLTPCYSVAGAVVRTGTSDAVTCDWSANGYRLPTEAEWEIAARGGLVGKRFPWGDTISQSQANYKADPSFAYDLSGEVNDYHPTYKTGSFPYTSPVGSFAANGYGLYDMAGNAYQWCWDSPGVYVAGIDPRGPASGNGQWHIIRGGNWQPAASRARCEERISHDPYEHGGGVIGFRLARGRSSVVGVGALSSAGVVDTVAPVLTNVPANVTVNATSASGANVTFSGASGTDNVGSPTFTYSPASGSTFAVGNTTVTVTATDNVGNTATGTFTVTVLPGVGNVSFAQRPDRSGLVDVSYNLLGGSSSVALAVSYDGGTTFNAVQGLTGDVGTAISAGSAKHIVWNAGADYPSSGSANVKMRVTALLDGAGGTFAPIPAGNYQRGDNLGDHVSGMGGNETVQVVTLSPYYLSVKDTTKVQWDAVKTWAEPKGYTDLAVGTGKASNHPVELASWYDGIKWANAASEKEGLTPCYNLNGSVVRTGTSDAVTCDWSANGYRLPTEAEWEVAARGGLIGKRFPWGDTISQSQANYKADSSFAYDLSGSVNDYHPTYRTGAQPYTSPVGSFAANGYGLYDMAGNTFNWCWDWHGSYVAGIDPRGPATGTGRMIRGGGYGSSAYRARCADRPTVGPSQSGTGFRLARGRASGLGDAVLSSAGVVDTVAPVLSNVPANVSVISGSAAVVTFGGATATDNVGTPTITYSPPSGSAFAVGYTTVTVTAVDRVGNTASSSFVVSVLPYAPNSSYFSQRTDGSKLVDIYYPLESGTANVSLTVSYDGGTTFNSVSSLTGDVGASISAGSMKHIVWNAGVDYPSAGSSNVKVRVTTSSLGAGTTFVPIPPGTYQRGDNLDGMGDAPVQMVTLSPYFMAVNDTTKAQWDTVRLWGLTNGYTDLEVGSGRAANHPVLGVNWYDVVKWANAASEKDGLTPCYSVSGSVVRTGTSDAVVCDWSASGYRLPTEAEWEIAARGGLVGKRFPLGDTISQSQANYRASSTYAYDLSGAVNDYHPIYHNTTSPVGSFAPNGYGLYDMGGNMCNWCWDWGGVYVAGIDPRGPATGNSRMNRGGNCGAYADSLRCAARLFANPGFRGGCGFRLARGASGGDVGLLFSNVGVVDTTAPVLASLPANVTVNATSASGANVTFSGASGTDNVGSPTFTYSPASGSTFAVGNTTVTATATDSVGNTATGTFTVTVLPAVTNVSFSQRTDGSNLVDVSYTLLGGSASVALDISYDGGTTYNYLVDRPMKISGDVGAAISAGTGKQIVWDAGADFASRGSANMKMRVTALLDGAGGTFAPIPAGTYQRGDSLDGETASYQSPLQLVTLSPYFMSVNDTTKAQWDAVRAWGLTHGYTDLAVGAGKAANHPVHTVSWYDAVNWANAASEKDGLTPCYSVNGAVVRTGTSDAVVCDWNASGYRLPTEAEWEIAARGGFVGKRFPFGDSISDRWANYLASGSYSYDGSGSLNDYHPTYKTGSTPYTSPVGSFQPNGYGLYDMAGNMRNWCWDWSFGNYVAGSDPRGPATGTGRVLRGGCWSDNADLARCSARWGNPPSYSNFKNGLRLARGRSSVLGVGAVSNNGVVDTVAPVLSNVPANVNVISGSASVVKFGGATATDNVGVPTITYSPPSGSTFAVGYTTVTVTARDSVGNTATGVFTVSVLPYASGAYFGQRADGSNMVDIFYTLQGGSANVALGVSYDGGATFNSVPSLTGDVGASIVAGSLKHIVWNAGVDYPNSGSANIKMRVTSFPLGAGSTFAPIPAGSYQRGDNFYTGTFSFAPVNVVTLSGYYMAVNDTTKEQWDTVRAWGLNNGYTDLPFGTGKAFNHPVVDVNWYDVVKWANAASEKDGLTPCYTVGGAVMRTGTLDAVTCDWGANGYRLPTEAQWEVAARGGLTGKRFPWGDTISQTQANYKASTAALTDPNLASYVASYDLSAAVNDYHPTYKTGSFPYTSPVGSFAPNGYGLYDMAGNVWNWCWDWYGFYNTSGAIDPTGPASSDSRMHRGGGWSDDVTNASKCAFRDNNRWSPSRGTLNQGFRLSRGVTGVGSGFLLTNAGVVDTKAPVLVNVPANVTASPTSASGASVTFGGASGTDNLGSPTITYSPTSGSTFAVGNTIVTVTASDAGGNTAMGAFTVKVLHSGLVSFAQRTDGSKKVDVYYSLWGGASDVALDVSYDGGATFFSVPSVTGDVGAAVAEGAGKHIEWNAGVDYPGAGSSNVVVRVTALVDGVGVGTQSSAGVIDTTDPVLKVPANLITDAMTATGATVKFGRASATDNVGNPVITFSQASGSTFAVGSKTVTATATDSFGNTSSGTFTVTVLPVVRDVSFAQRADGSKKVDVFFTLWGDASSVALLVSLDGGATFNSVPSITVVEGSAAASAAKLAGAAAATYPNLGSVSVTAGAGKQLVWDAAADYPNLSSSSVKMRVLASMAGVDETQASINGAGGSFAPIAAGTYSIGNLSGDSDIRDADVVTIPMSSYYMAVNDTTKAQWDAVRVWAGSHGYSDLATGAGKAADHPVQMVSWYDAVKWANAASEQEGLTPCYSVSSGVYRTGKIDSVTCDWSVNGYRLPTEAEWEVGARGGLTGKRFPWGDIIGHDKANYVAGSYSYEASAQSGYHPTYKVNGYPYTSPVGSFPANDYGLYDMAGNVYQWCWDIYGAYVAERDPRGTTSGTRRVVRGGLWGYFANVARCARRASDLPGSTNDVYGFRLVRGERGTPSGVGALDTTGAVAPAPSNGTTSQGASGANTQSVASATNAAAISGAGASKPARVSEQSWADRAGTYEGLLTDVSSAGANDGAIYRGAFVATFGKSKVVSGRLFYNEAKVTAGVQGRVYTPVTRAFSGALSEKPGNPLVLQKVVKMGTATASGSEELTVEVSFVTTPPTVNVTVKDFASPGGVGEAWVSQALNVERSVAKLAASGSIAAGSLDYSKAVGRYTLSTNELGLTNVHSSDAYVLAQLLPTGKLLWFSRLNGSFGTGSAGLRVTPEGLSASFYEGRSSSSASLLKTTSILGDLNFAFDSTSGAWSSAFGSTALPEKVEKQASNGAISSGTLANHTGVTTLDFSNGDGVRWESGTLSGGSAFLSMAKLLPLKLKLSVHDVLPDAGGAAVSYAWNISIASTGKVTAIPLGDVRGTFAPRLTFALDRTRGEFTGYYISGGTGKTVRRNLYGSALTSSLDELLRARGWVESGVAPALSTGGWTLKLGQ